MLSAEVERVLADVHRFVGSDDGRSAIRSALQRRRLPGSFDVEIEEAVLGEALRFLRGGATIGSVPAWCRARIGARAVDLSRGLIRRERRFGVQVPFDDVSDGPAACPDGSLDDVPADLPADLRSMRAELLGSGADDTVVAGALTVVARVADEAAPLPECPSPRAGADEGEAAVWVALWYLGVRDCFGSGNTPAKRRSRAAAGIRTLLGTLGGGARR